MTVRDRTRCVTVDIEDNIGILTFDVPDETVNAITPAFLSDFDTALGSLPPDLRGLILTSGKEGQFVAGADLTMLVQATDSHLPENAARTLQRTLNRLGTLPYPTVAALNGAALGGGLEIALACDYRVCVESEKSILGLPEVGLGLLPAGGGTQRLPRLIGLTSALALILPARRYSPRRARRYGVVDEVVHPAVLMQAARHRLTRGKRVGHPRWGWMDRAALRFRPVRFFVYRRAERTVRRESRGHYPAPARALDAVRAGQEQGMGAGLAAEAVFFGELASGLVAHNLIGLFLAAESLKSEQRSLAPLAHPVRRIGIVGAGFMGAGIAQAAAVAGYTVRLRDLKPEMVARCLKSVRDLTTSAVRRGRFSRPESAAIVARISGTTDWSGFGHADLAIEAVFEDVEVKRAVIAELEGVLPADTVIASNTSSLPIAEISAGALHPERIVGMHFFSPVHRMPLLEVIRSPASSDESVATAVRVGHALGKTVIVVRDGPGFYVVRVLGFMVQQAGSLLTEGASIEAIDRAMVEFGFPVGPLALSDEVGLDVSAHVESVLSRAFPTRFQVSDSIRAMVAQGRLGRKSGRGFYDYTGRKKKPDVSVYRFCNATPRSIPSEYIQRRLALAFVNEAARCLEEGIIAMARDGDVGAVMGVAFPPFLGGPFRYADSLGIPAVVAQLLELEDDSGPGYVPTPLLRRMAEEGKRFYGE